MVSRASQPHPCLLLVFTTFYLRPLLAWAAGCYPHGIVRDRITSDPKRADECCNGRAWAFSRRKNSPVCCSTVPIYLFATGSGADPNRACGSDCSAYLCCHGCSLSSLARVRTGCLRYSRAGTPDCFKGGAWPADVVSRSTRCHSPAVVPVLSVPPPQLRSSDVVPGDRIQRIRPACSSRARLPTLVLAISSAFPLPCAYPRCSALDDLRSRV